MSNVCPYNSKEMNGNECPFVNGIGNDFNNSLVPPIEFSNCSHYNDVRGYALCGTNSNKSSDRLRAIDGPLLVQGDACIEGDLIVRRDMSVSNDGLADSFVGIGERIQRLEKIVEFLCEKFHIDIEALDKEFKNLEKRTDVEKRLDAVN